MRRFVFPIGPLPIGVLPIVVLLASGSQGFAEDSGADRGVFGPSGSTPGQLQGVNNPGAEGSLGPAVNVPGKPAAGDRLPQTVRAAPIPGRAGYGSVIVNGRRAIVEQSTNRIVEYAN